MGWFSRYLHVKCKNLHIWRWSLLVCDFQFEMARFQGRNKKTNEIVAMKKIRLESEDEGVSALWTGIWCNTETGAFNSNPRDLLVEGAAASKHCLPEGCTHAGGQALPYLWVPHYGPQEVHGHKCAKGFLLPLAFIIDPFLIQDGQMDPVLVKSYTYQLLQGLLFCHQRRVLHRYSQQL